MEECCLLAHSTGLFILFFVYISDPRVSPSTVGWIFPYQSEVKKMPRIPAYKSDYGSIFFCDSFSLVSSRLCQVDKYKNQLTNQPNKQITTTPNQTKRKKSPTRTALHPRMNNSPVTVSLNTITSCLPLLTSLPITLKCHCLPWS